MLGSGTMDAMAIAAGQLGVSFQHSVPDWDRLPGAAVIRGAGGVARQVEAAGVTWSVAGARTAVDDVCDALGEGA
jgi:fructose-1,6-bisphosphatase/inositol monophosphatase family enzyme